MKTIFLFLIFCIIISIIPQKVSAQEASLSFQIFYDELSPYGTWVETSEYGYVWVPNVDQGFTPYATNGYWVFTDDGWTWVSNYPWGWAPFHYGRWYTDAIYGPMWVPDYEWSPGWVSWRRSGDYYGWAPIGPGISISIAFGSGYNEHYNHYTFLSGRHFGRRNINKYYVNYSNNDTYFNNSTVINNIRVDKRRNISYQAGPDRAEVSKRVGRPITPIVIKERSKPGQIINKNQLQIYRPQVQKNIPNGHKPTPAKVEKLNNVKPLAQRTVNKQLQKVNQPIRQQQAQPAFNKKQAQPKQQQAQPKQQQAQPKQQQAKPKQQQVQQKQQQAQPKQQQAKPKQQQAQPKQQQVQQKQQQAQPKQQQAQPKQQQAKPKQQQAQPKQQAPQQQQANPPQNQGGEQRRK
jgi:hypothetical protein